MKKNNKREIKVIFSIFTTIYSQVKECKTGMYVFTLTLLLLSILAGSNFERQSEIYIAGDVAQEDITAKRDMLIEDAQATQLRRDRAMLLQAPVYDLSLEPYTIIHKYFLDLIEKINITNYVELSNIRLTPEIHLNSKVNQELVAILSKAEVQNYFLDNLLPFIYTQVLQGILADMRVAPIGKGGVIIRNLDTSEEILRANLQAVPDVKSAIAEISVHLNSSNLFTPSERNAIVMLISQTLTPSLILNREATKLKAENVARNVAPILYQLSKGEVVIRKGEIVGRKEQIKLQAIYSSGNKTLSIQTIIGIFCISLITSIGLFLAPSGRLSNPLKSKDFLLISVLLIIFSLGAKSVYSLGLQIGDLQIANGLAYAYPVAGAVGLFAMIFAAKRYCTMGLLLSIICTIIFDGGIDLFIYYFLSGMFATYIVNKAHTRQDVVWSIIPLTVGLIVLCIASSMLAHIGIQNIPFQLSMAITNSILSLLLLFAFSPILELVFKYTTRFRLMELMSLEQPLMQEIMVSMPGTYHHSLVVSNMVEAGAKAVGANSLLCKVSALYHDVGKLSRPDYFIENQFGGKNKHDKLAPSMSALVLTSHVKKGVELAAQNGLGTEIQDIIHQHHGTRLIRFFYQKALNLGENPRTSDYSYPGPRPRSKEAAILMLADVVEASCRTLSEPTPSKIKQHSDRMIKDVFAEGQLDESELTFKELTLLSESFSRILTGIFHQRIAYPDTKKT